jgi:hypothetical protein
MVNFGGFSPLNVGTKKPLSEETSSLSVEFMLTIVFSLVFGNWLPFRFRDEGPVVLRPTLSSGLPFRTRRSEVLAATSSSSL